MRKAILTLVALVATGAVFAPKASAEPLDTGSCYSARPICISPSTAVCVCSITQQCFWACK